MGSDSEVEKTAQKEREKKKLLAIAPIAKPLAGKKLSKRTFKLVRIAAENKCLKRGVKEVVKTIRRGGKGTITIVSHDLPKHMVYGSELQQATLVHIQLISHGHWGYDFCPTRGRVYSLDGWNDTMKRYEESTMQYLTNKFMVAVSSCVGTNMKEIQLETNLIKLTMQWRISTLSMRFFLVTPLLFKCCLTKVRVVIVNVVFDPGGSLYFCNASCLNEYSLHGSLYSIVLFKNALLIVMGETKQGPVSWTNILNVFIMGIAQPVKGLLGGVEMKRREEIWPNALSIRLLLLVLNLCMLQLVMMREWDYFTTTCVLYGVIVASNITRGLILHWNDVKNHNKEDMFVMAKICSVILSIRLSIWGKCGYLWKSSRFFFEDGLWYQSSNIHDSEA